MTALARPQRAAILDRDETTCVRCGSTVWFFPYSLHHRRPRGSGGAKDPRINQPANILTLCGSGTTGCHGHVESYRADALDETGYLLYRIDEAETTPVLTWRGWRYFLNDGTVVEA